MPDILLYLLRVNIALVVFYLIYFLVLRRLTFYTLNRAFLLFGIVFSVVYPFADVSALLNRNQPLQARLIELSSNWQLVQVMAQPTGFDYWQLVPVVFWLGVGLMAVRLLIQLASLYRIHLLSRPAQHLQYLFRRVSGNVNPFSFWRNIYLNPDKHAPQELAPILQHEQIHVQGWHTADVLAGELCAVFFWFNPGAWLLNHAIKQNLEFIADRQVLETGLDSKTYQYSLVRISQVSAGSTALVNHFNFFHLKTRIAMMNKKPSTRVQQIKFLVVLPVIVLLLVAFTGPARSILKEDLAAVRELAQSVLPDSRPAAADTLNPAGPDAPLRQLGKSEAFLKANPDISWVGYKQWREAGKHQGFLLVRLKSGTEETYDFNDPQWMTRFKSKYKMMPPPPPPLLMEDRVPPPPAPPVPAVPATPAAMVAAPPAPPAPPAPGLDNLLELRMGNSALPPVYYLNDEKVTAQVIQDLDPKEIKSVEVYKGKSAVARYGQDGENGVVSVNSKTTANITLETTKGGDPLYLVDGVRAHKSEVHSLDPKSILTMDVLKGEPATDRYGAGAKNGVVLITTRGKDTSDVPEKSKDAAQNDQPEKLKEVTVSETVKFKAPAIKKKEEIREEGSAKEKEMQVLRELRSDGLYSNDQLYTFKITNSAMYINGQKQSEALFRKYRKYLPAPNKNVPGQQYQIKGRFKVE